MERSVLSSGPSSRFLMVGDHPDWVPLVTEVAGRCGAEFDVVADVQTALMRMLRPHRPYTHVLACGPMRSRDVDALAGMLDEVTLHTTQLVMLGAGGPGDTMVQHVATPDAKALTQALLPQAGVAAPLTQAELVAALHRGGLRMRFQPIVRWPDLHPIGIEALARVHTRRGIIHPKDFIPATIASGRERVLTSIAAARTFLDVSSLASRPDLFVTINLPIISLLHPSALRRGVELCAMAGVTPARVMIEVLESPTLPDLAELEHALVDWRKAGFRMAIDDAGPALPHWRAMMQLPFDAVKLDGAMIGDPALQDLLNAIVAAAKERGLFVIAEGIEDEACLKRAESLQADALQGYLFSRPLPGMALPLWLDQWAERPRPEAAEAA